MGKRIRPWVGLIFLFATAPGFAQTRLIVRAAAAEVDDVAGRHELTVEREVTGHDLFLVSTATSADPETLVSEVEADPSVAWAELDGEASLPELAGAGMGVDPTTSAALDALADRTNVDYYGAAAWTGYVDQPSGLLVRLPDVRALPLAGAGVVAVIDTGVDPNHPVLQGSLVDGYDFIHELPGLPSELSDLDQSTANILDQSTANILDASEVVFYNPSTGVYLDQSTANILDGSQLPAEFGHGTMVAGIVHLVAPSAKIMPLKAFRADGTADVFDLLRAIYYAVDHGARVINMSFSLAAPSEELMRAVNYATGNKVVCVASVGNAGREALVYPAAFQNVLGVASTDPLDRRSGFSNYGAALADLAAPGEGIVTTYPGGRYAAGWGTSFSAPFAAGAAAVLLEIKLGLEQGDAEEALAHGVQVASDLGGQRLDLYLAALSRY